MSAPFSRSAAHYDLVYADKDYAAEAAFVARLIRARRPGSRALLELGCGTGRHASELARAGFRVRGVDSSAAMLARARPASGVVLTRGDIRRLRLRARFDAVVSLFHVFSYLRSARDLRAALRGAAAHLAPGGVLVFDCWHEAAVVARPLRARRKLVEDERRRLERLSRTSFDARRRVALVHHAYRVVDKATGRVERFKERHQMRCWSRPEIETALRVAGFDVWAAREWMTGRPLGAGSWSACYVAVKRRETVAARAARLRRPSR